MLLWFASVAATQHRTVDGAGGREAAAGVRERQVRRLPGPRAHLLLPQAPQPLPGVRFGEWRAVAGVSHCSRETYICLARHVSE